MWKKAVQKGLGCRKKVSCCLMEHHNIPSWYSSGKDRQFQVRGKKKLGFIVQMFCVFGRTHWRINATPTTYTISGVTISKTTTNPVADAPAALRGIRFRRKMISYPVHGTGGGEGPPPHASVPKISAVSITSINLTFLFQLFIFELLLFCVSVIALQILVRCVHTRKVGVKMIYYYQTVPRNLHCAGGRFPPGCFPDFPPATECK